MADSSSADTTKLLRAWASGDSKALDELTPRVYRELRRMAARLLQNERPGYSLQSADLVHEVYLRLVNALRKEARRRSFAPPPGSSFAYKMLAGFVQYRTWQS